MEPSAPADPLSDIAARLADGEYIDWHSLESSAADEPTRELIRQFRAIAEIERAHAVESFLVASSRQLSSATPSTAFDSLPASWGPLRVLEVIGHGRFGTVYRAWDPALDREVALKLLHRPAPAPLSGAVDVDVEGAVIHEARLMARVRHPNVVTIFGAQRADGHTGIWMELIEGQTLEAELKARGPFPPGEVAVVGLEICRALTAVHGANLVHRDVKAQNILREVTGRIALGDFGTGHEIDEADGAAGMAGTPAYLAPEIFKRGAATPRSDLYSTGALLFHLATGSYPVLGRTLKDIAEAHVHGRRDSLLALRPDFPTGLAAVIERALAPEPDERFLSAGEMERALHRAMGPGGTRGSTRRRLALAGALVVGVVTVIWAVRGDATPDASGAAVAAGASRLAQRQLSDNPELAGRGSPSPDGRFLSFDASSGNLMIQDLLTGQQRQITNNGSPDRYTGTALHSRFSSDGQEIFYVWHPEPFVRAELRRIALDGAADRLVWSAPAGRELTLGHWAGRGDVVAALLGADNEPFELVLLDASGRETRRRLPPSNQGWVSLAPDGRTVAFDTFQGKTASVHLIRPDGHSAPLIDDGNYNLSPLWAVDGRYLVYLSDRTGDVGLWAQRVDRWRAVGAPIRIEPSLGVAYPMGLTERGSYVFRRQIGGRDVYVAQLDEQGTLIGEPARLVNSRGDATGTSAWSPDEQQVAFFRRRDYRRSLVVYDISTRTEREFADGVEGVGRPRWEPDGRSILFKGTYRGEYGLHRLHLSSSTIETVTGPVVFYEVTRTGELVLTRDLRQFFLRRGNREEPLHTAAGNLSGMAVSSDGHRLAYSATVGKTRRLVVLDIDGAAPSRDVLTVPANERVEVFAWTPDGQALLAYRTRRADGVNGVWRIDVRSGAGRWIGIKDGPLQEFRLSPSGRQLSYDVGSPFQEPWALDNVLSRLNQE